MFHVFIGLARECSGQWHPQGGKKKMGVIYRGKLSVHPQTQQEVNFLRKFLLGWESWRVGVVNLAVLA